LDDRDEILASLATAADFIRFGASSFNAARLHFGHGTDNALDESRALVLHALHLDHDTPHTCSPARWTLSEKRSVLALFERRIAERKAGRVSDAPLVRRPQFYVDERVLVPRSPIAELIEQGFEPWLDGAAVTRVLDLVHGSGCIAIACASAFSARTSMRRTLVRCARGRRGEPPPPRTGAARRADRVRSLRKASPDGATISS
jgi:ribosomal protein L3 glutamine methyltransferase